MFSWDFESSNGHIFDVDTSVVGMLFQKLKVCYEQLLFKEEIKTILQYGLRIGKWSMCM
jgi:hypothetical protein